APLAALALVALAAGGIVAWRHQVRANWQPHITRTTVDFDEDSTIYAIAPDGKRVAWDGRRNGIWRVYVGPRAGGSGRPVTADGYQLFGWSADGHGLYVHDVSDLGYRVDLADGSMVPIGAGILSLVDCGRFGVATVERNPQSCPWCTKAVLRRSDGMQELLRPIDPAESIRQGILCDVERGRVTYSIIR